MGTSGGVVLVVVDASVVAAQRQRECETRDVVRSPLDLYVCMAPVLQVDCSIGSKKCA